MKKFNSRISVARIAATATLLVCLIEWSLGQVPPDVPWSTPNGKIVQKGMAIATMHALSNENSNQRYVLRIYDTRLQPSNFSGYSGTSYTDLWNPTTYQRQEWLFSNLGNVFGLTYDRDINLYVTAIGQAPDIFYGGMAGYGPLAGYDASNPSSPASVAAAGAVYKIDKETGAASVFAMLPQQLMSQNNGFFAPGLGQITYDSLHHQLFVSNFEDGKIYRLGMNGAILSTFDPLNPDNGAPEMAPKPERVWALCVGKNYTRLYYSINANDVRSVGLDGAGDFITASDQAEFTVPFALNDSYIADIAFNTSNTQLLVAQRNTDGNPFTVILNHRSLGYLYDFNLVTGVATLNRTIQVGNDRECLGGCDFGPLNVDTVSGVVTGPEEMHWFSSADMIDNLGPHGLMASPLSHLGNLQSGNIPEAANYTSHWGNSIYSIDYNQILNHDSKGSGGDVDIFDYGTASCVITVTSATPSVCDPNTNTYSLNVVVTYSNAPGGNITVNTSNGGSITVAATTSPQTITLTGLTADGVQDIDVTAFFVNDPACTHTLADAYDAPVGCRRDFGDLPDTSPGTGAGNYQTLINNNGPCHTIVQGLKIGALIDHEIDGQPSALADRDDNNGDDEDGITAFPVFTAGSSANVTVSVMNMMSPPSAATLYGFIDWNNDGDFLDANETSTVSVPNGTNGNVVLTFNVPAGAVVGTNLGARFRLSTQSGLTAHGCATDGEVEDYIVQAVVACSVAQQHSTNCNDNGTPANNADDWFNLLITGTVTGGSGQYVVKIGAFTSPVTPSGTQITIAGNGQGGNPLLQANGSATYTVRIEDAANPNCFIEFVTAPVSPCSACPNPNCVGVRVTKF